MQNPIQKAIDIVDAARAANTDPVTQARIAELERELDDLRAPRSAREYFAREIGVTASAVAQWLTEETAVSIRHFSAIEKATEGKITAAELLAFEQRRLEAKAASRKVG